MKTASSLIQIVALASCFAVYASGGGAISSGVRRALQTMTSVTVQMPAPADECSFTDACV